MKEISLMLFGALLFLGCGTMDLEEEKVVQKGMIQSVFNQAYQENYEPDTLSEIMAKAKNAYVLLDPFEGNIVSKIEKIKIQNNSVGGYISVGTGENYRDDFAKLEPYLSSKAWEDWDDEFFVNETTTGILPIMKKRINTMATWGLDWVEFDNMDWLDDESRKQYNLKVTKREAKRYIKSLCSYTHRKGMKCMAKNTVDGFDMFDGVLYESFANNKNWWDEEGTKRFLKANKVVIINHYNEKHCDAVYKSYKKHYKSNKILFICEDISLKKYKHYTIQ